MQPRKPAAGIRLPTPEMLLHTAECLFAEHGIATVSNRRVAEVAGAANNSAVLYHYRNKTGLLLAIVRKHNTELEEIRGRMLAEAEGKAAGKAESGAGAGSDDPRDYIACLVLPLTEYLRRLGPPTWYARFSLQAMTDPSFAGELTRELAASPSHQRIWARLTALVDSADHEVLRHRSRLVMLVIVHACANFERELADGKDRTTGGGWDDVGHFLLDAVAGLLLAPVTRPPGS
ncbi:TetR/AcrR family transcriptional regulator [Streptomyces paludis]|uniref:TetR/AcrR family transcriptional regulator n=1 Tax=Streptomyces paludis TaxID=2282738 RepID=A0A345HWE7_9ACTN|nr:helix-turn-helix domain-containing protein [Streptomyces paludis]AXG81021.1 TetR/AcrR family transcriptional regulator [Streptomyces paludis]